MTRSATTTTPSSSPRTGPPPDARTWRSSRQWTKGCPGAVTSLEEAGAELLTFFRYPRSQWKSWRTTNSIERLHLEFRRRVKTQGSFPTADAALALLYGLVASGQIVFRKLEGWQDMARALTIPAPTAEEAA